MTLPFIIRNHAFLLPVDGVGLAPINLRGPVDLDSVDSDYNAFYIGQSDPAVLWTNPPPGMPDRMTLAEWQARGKDRHSNFFDPADPEVAANMAFYRERDLSSSTALIVAPCCARFLFCTDTIPGYPCPEDSQPVFMQHLSNKAGPVGWSDYLSYGFLFTKTYCGDCGNDGLLAEMP